MLAGVVLVALAIQLYFLRPRANDFDEAKINVAQPEDVLIAISEK